MDSATGDEVTVTWPIYSDPDPPPKAGSRLEDDTCPKCGSKAGRVVIKCDLVLYTNCKLCGYRSELK